MSRLIDADKIDFNEVFGGQSDFAKDTREAAESLIDVQPTVETVPKSYVDQIRWERDIAIEQLNEIGCQFGQKMDEVKKKLEASQWIPCSERLPKSENKYGYVKCNVTVMRSHYPTSSYDICDEPYDEYFVADAMYDVSQKIWHLGEHTQLNALIDIEDLPLNCDYVIAWMPLPEPYKGEYK